MKPSLFEYYTPRTVEECLELLDEHGEDAKLLAGGQSLVPLMNLRMATPEVIVDLNQIGGMDYIEDREGDLVIGAMTRYADVETSTLVRERFPILTQATGHVGYPAVRNRGTVGGALAHADPVGEWPCLALTLDAQLVARGPRGTRTIAAADFFAGIFTTALDVDEVLAEVRFPRRPDHGGWAFAEFAPKTGDYAIVAVAVDLDIVDGAVSSARVGFSNLGDRPVRSAGVERLLAGHPVAAELEPAVAKAVPAVLHEERVAEGAPEDRVALAGVLACRTITEALGRAVEHSA